MRQWSRLLLLSLGAALAVVSTGCTRAPETPQETVAFYFESLGSDPRRLAPYLSPRFHESHGLRMADLAGWFHAGDTPAGQDETPGLEAWMLVQSDPFLQLLARQLEVEPVEAERLGDHASVTVRILPPEGFPFRQRFELRRGAEGQPWLIDGVVQTGLVPATTRVAFAAWPSRSMLRWLRPPQREAEPEAAERPSGD